MPRVEEVKVKDGVPDDYPGKVVAFPDNVDHMIYGMFGVQSKDAVEARRYADELIGKLGSPSSAQHFERGRFMDRWDHHNELVMAYFLGEEAYSAVVNGAEFSTWWAGLPNDARSDLGFYKEVCHCRKDYFEYAAGGEEAVAAATLLKLEGSDKFGYWGAYRDRIPASTRDTFRPAIDVMPQERNDNTKGHRLTVTTPDNMCFIREGQGHANSTPEEKAIWESSMEAKIKRWITYLGDDPAKTGCISIRDCEEYDLDSGNVNQRFSQNAFLISLAHIERAAKTVCEHTELRQGLIDMYTQSAFVPQMHLYVEVQILQSDELEIEYVNCHPKTGFLRFFESRDVN